MGKKTLTVPTEKRKQNSNTGCFSFPQIYPQVAVVCVLKACLSVLSGRIMRSLTLSLSASLCLSHDSQSIWFYANKRGAGPIKSLCVRGAPPHTLRGVAIKEKREGERESVITYYSLSSLVKMATQGRVQTLLFTLHTAHHLIILLTAPAHC